MPSPPPAQRNGADRAAVAIVTGAASGIGLATARRLLADGYRLGLGDTSPRLAELFAPEVSEGAVVTVVGDLADEAVRRELVEAATEAFGGIDALVNNAAAPGESAEVAAIDLDALRRTLEVNVVAVIGLTQLVVPLLERSPRGRIVNMGSLFGDEPVAGGGPYCASKGAIHTLTRVLAIELGPAGITCNTVAPGFILTPMHAEEVEFQAREQGITAEQRYAELRERVPLRRHGAPEDVADTVAWLLGDDSRYVSGQRIAVNGGVQFG
ncbi:SDR family oxidoreductase [Leucobacter sp. CSA1]|uniref:SDR family oxidoreductase n=1 Tax=Leucobacter chromiisoli TaxID=2796471 RepID=A0A934UUV2_9MICO|nr:SDR family oxidoreductase [Leucobacter chromiisoli]MBK0418821.1 SDR family oxidoreductase [Leucobacter chromiisoli]